MHDVDVQYGKCFSDANETAVTLLHVAASLGLVSMAERLSVIPDAFIASSLTDLDGQTPAHLARSRGNLATAAVINRLANQHTAFDSSEYDMIRDAILTCALKPT